MEGYRKELKKELIICRILMIIFLCLFIPVVLVDKSRSFISYLVYAGMLGGLIGVASGRFRNEKKALKDDESLKKAYVESHDERNILLGHKNSDITFAISMYGFALAGVISSFFSATVASTLFVSFLVICVVHLVTYWYYSKRM